MASQSLSPVRLRPLLLPTEHGGWGLLFEPVIVSLIAAPSSTVALLSVAALAFFLARQPLKIAMDDVRRRRVVPRTVVAWWAGAAYGLAGLVAVASAGVASAHSFWLVALLSAPLAMISLWFDSRGESRQLIPEMAGAAALGTVACAAGLSAGFSLLLALSLWFSTLVRVLPALVTVRERVRRLRGAAANGRGPLIAHLLALACAAGFATLNLMPWGVALVAILLAGRAAWDLRPGAPTQTAIQIGTRELVTGLLAAGAMGAIWATWMARV